MTTTASLCLIAFLPFLLALAGSAEMPKMLCLVTSILTLLLSVEPVAAVLPWTVGMAIAVMSVRQRVDQCRRLAWVRSLRNHHHPSN